MLSQSRPLLGHGEATSSIAWLPNQSNCLVAGMGTRFLRTFDIRGKLSFFSHPGHDIIIDQSVTRVMMSLPWLLPHSDEHAVQTHPREVASHKAILGLCVDPTSTHQLATYAEVGVCVRGEGCIQCLFSPFFLLGCNCLHLGYQTLCKARILPHHQSCSF